MVDISSDNNKINVQVSSAMNKNNTPLGVTYNYYDNIAKQWAISEDMINGEDYSSKHYAQESKNQAKIATQKAQESVDKGNEALSNISTQENLSKNSVKTEGDAQVARIKTETKNFATKAEAKYTAGSGIAINNNVISNTQSFAKWGNISGEITAQTDLVQYIKNNTPDINNYQINNPYSLFDCKFADHKLDNLSWLCSEGQYNNGSVYVASYNELLSEYNNSESIEKTENKITFKRTPKGYKIALASQKTTIDNLYSTTGVAWFYILDVENQQFILPRTKYGFSGTRNNVGDYISESLPNIKGTFYSAKNETDAGTGCIKYIGDTGINAGSYAIYGRKVEFDASFYSSTYQDNAPVQERSTQMHLYFYVGDTLQNTDLINIAKMQEELVTINATKRAYLIDSYINETSWYRVFSDGWCEQGGLVNINTETNNVQVAFTKAYFSIPNVTTTVSSDTAYSSNTGSGNINSINSNAGSINRVTKNGFYFNHLNNSSNSGTGNTMWRACGYIK